MGNENKILNPDTITDTEAYRQAIENLASTADDHIFNNASPEHAAIVLGNILKNAEDSVQIFAGDFNGAVSDNPYYLENLKSYLSKKKPLTIIFENDPNAGSLALRTIKQYSNNKCISIRILKKGVDLKRLPHFTIADGRMFRMEVEKEKYKAICSFNNKEIVTPLQNAFEKLLEHSEVLAN